VEGGRAPRRGPVSEAGGDPSPGGSSLGPDEEAVVDEALADLQAQEGPVDRGPLGCVLSVPAFLVLLMVPVLARSYGLPSSVAQPLILGGIVLLVLGLTLWFTAGGFVRGHVSAAAEAGLRTLEEWDEASGTREEALRAATLVVMNAYASYGPSTVQTFEPEDARSRLGARLPLVEAVERHLLEKGVTYPVFTDRDEGGEEGPPAGGDAAP